MKRYRNLLFYVVTIAFFSAAIFFIVKKGEKLRIIKAQVSVPTAAVSSWDQFKDNYLENLTHPLGILLLQILTIILVARFFGFICRKIRQPTVIGEIVAGIFLGPSIVGMYFPEVSAFLFPKQSFGNLQFLSQIGLILFMFVIGMELDLKVLKNKAKDAVVISHASIIFPFTLGVGLAYFLYKDLAPAHINFLSFSLFIGIAMSITAFPVLARIVQERGISKTRLGNIVITCAAADDITAWCILVAVIAIVKAGSLLNSFYTILMSVSYVIIMMKLVQPFLKILGEKYSNKESFSKPVVAIFFITLLLSSFVTEVIGIHALFGAFMAGVIMPSTASFRNIFIEKIEDVSTVLLLPLFFVFTGLRTQIGLLSDPHLWWICLLIITVAVIGKFVGSALAARFVGQNWKDSLSIGALMNTRGLMELIVLNIGYDLGVLTPEIFAMLVLMAVATTFMTGPALDIINHFYPEKKVHTKEESIERRSQYNILLSFGKPEKGISLLKLAGSMIRKIKPVANITALHLSPSNELNQFNLDVYEKESFEPIEKKAKEFELPLITSFKATQDVAQDIIHSANTGNYDILLIGAGTSIYEGTLLGKVLGFTSKIVNPERLYDTITGKERLFESSFFDERVKSITKNVKIPVGIFLDKGLQQTKVVFIPLFTISDSFLLIYAQKFIHNSGARIIVLDASGVIQQNPEIKASIESIGQSAPNHITLHHQQPINKSLLGEHDIVLMSFDSFKKEAEVQSDWLSDTASVLIIKP